MPRCFLAVIGAAALTGWGAISPAALAAERNSAATAIAERYGGLPEGPGRTAVYFNCTACHSLKPFLGQRKPREEWEKLLDRMVEKNKMHPMETWARLRVLDYLDIHLGVDTEDWQGLPAGPGREEVFYKCQACHSLAIVKQQGLNRDSWEESLVWMVEEQEMERLEADERNLVLDYLSKHFGRESSRQRRR